MAIKVDKGHKEYAYMAIVSCVAIVAIVTLVILAKATTFSYMPFTNQDQYVPVRYSVAQTVISSEQPEEIQKPAVAEVKEPSVISGKAIEAVAEKPSVAPFEMYLDDKSGLYKQAISDVYGIGQNEYFYLEIPFTGCYEKTDRGFSPVVPSYASSNKLESYEAVYTPAGTGSIIQEQFCKGDKLVKVLVKCNCGVDFAYLDGPISGTKSQVNFCKPSC